MIRFLKPFGYNFYSNSIGGLWIDTVRTVIESGETTFDESRERKSLQNVRVRVDGQNLLKADNILDSYAQKDNILAVVYLTFQADEMYDFDVIPSFSPGAKSYYARIEEGRMLEFVVKRLSRIPESKKAVISFIHWDDYKAVLDTPYDDYLPCISTVQFRVFKETSSAYHMNVNFNARSLDIFQKGHGNMVAISMLASKVAKQLSENLGKEVRINCLDGFISDIHVYSECLSVVREILDKFDKDNQNVK